MLVLPASQAKRVNQAMLLLVPRVNLVQLVVMVSQVPLVKKETQVTAALPVLQVAIATCQFSDRKVMLAFRVSQVLQVYQARKVFLAKMVLRVWLAYQACQA